MSARPYVGMIRVSALAHKLGDSVAVAVEDLKKGDTVTVAYLDSSSETTLILKSDVPLGHKIALKDIKTGEDVIEYGHVIGYASAEISAGEHVHVHNLKSKRWSN